ncbi:hypothetical protein ACQ4PT_020219 [Festuca glaucescens]
MAADSSNRKAPGGKPQFLKVLFAEFMEKMPIPAKFMRRHLAAEPGIRRATLVSPLKKFWHVDVVRDGHGGEEDVYFAGGWAEFVRANGLEDENFLVFRYEGNMVFTVKVFETSGCIKDYSVDVAGAGTSTVAATLEHTAPKKRSGTGCGSQNTSKTHSGMNANKTRKISERKLTGDGDIPSKKQCRSHRILMEDNGDEQDITAEKNTQADTHSDSGIATEAKESDYTSILPVYSKVATPCNIRYSYMVSSRYASKLTFISFWFLLVEHWEEVLQCERHHIESSDDTQGLWREVVACEAHADERPGAHEGGLEPLLQPPWDQGRRHLRLPSCRREHI